MKLSAVDGYSLRRALSRLDPDPTLTPSPFVTSIISSLQKNEDYQNLERLLMTSGMMVDVMSYDPYKPPVMAKRDEKQLSIPPLPQHAQLSKRARELSKHVGGWLDEYMEWAKARTPMTPHSFLLSGGICLISIAIAGRLGVRVHDEVLPHLYVLWIASTTRYAKSTGLKAVKHIIDRVMPHMTMPEESTPEAMIQSLSGKQPENFGDLSRPDQDMINEGLRFASRRGLIIDEASSLLGATVRKDYMAGLDELILKAFDAPPTITRSVARGGLTIIHRPALSILGATAPTALTRVMTWEKWTKGDNARFAMIFCKTPLPYSDSVGEYNAPNSVVDALAKLHHQYLPKPPEVGLAPETWWATIDADARRAFNEYSRAMVEMTEAPGVDERIKGNLGRLPVLALKVAICLCAIDWVTKFEKNDRPTITLGHWARAQMIAEDWRESVFNLLVALDESVEYRNQQKIENLLSTSPSGLTVRDLVRLSSIPTRDINIALQSMIDAGVVAQVDTAPPTGRPTKTYVWLT